MLTTIATTAALGASAPSTVQAARRARKAPTSSTCRVARSAPRGGMLPRRSRTIAFLAPRVPRPDRCWARRAALRATEARDRSPCRYTARIARAARRRRRARRGAAVARARGRAGRAGADHLRGARRRCDAPHVPGLQERRHHLRQLRRLRRGEARAPAPVRRRGLGWRVVGVLLLTCDELQVQGRRRCLDFLLFRFAVESTRQYRIIAMNAAQNNVWEVANHQGGRELHANL